MLQTATQPRVTVAFRYDARQQVTGTTVAGQSIARYAYDPADRVTRIDDESGTTTLQYDPANQLSGTLDVTTGHQTSTFSYDQSGNRTTRQPIATGGLPSTPAPTTHDYDQANHLTAVHKASTGPLDLAINRTYSYDGNGLRGDLLWDRTSKLPLILADNTAMYITGPDGLPLEQIALDGTRHYYHHDQLGSTRVLTTTTAPPPPAATTTRTATPQPTIPRPSTPSDTPANTLTRRPASSICAPAGTIQRQVNSSR